MYASDLWVGGPIGLWRSVFRIVTRDNCVFTESGKELSEGV